MQKLQNKINSENINCPPPSTKKGTADPDGREPAAAGAAPFLNRKGKKKCEKGINRDMFLLGNISGGITGDYIFWSAGIYPGSYGFNLLSPRPFNEPRAGGGYPVCSLDPRASPGSERCLRTHLSPLRSPRIARLRRPALGKTKSEPSAKLIPAPGRTPPPLRPHSRRNRSGGGWPLPAGVTGRAAQGQGCSSSPTKTSFFVKKIKTNSTTSPPYIPPPMI